MCTCLHVHAHARPLKPQRPASHWTQAKAGVHTDPTRHMAQHAHRRTSTWPQRTWRHRRRAHLRHPRRAIGASACPSTPTPAPIRHAATPTHPFQPKHFVAVELAAEVPPIVIESGGRAQEQAKRQDRPHLPPCTRHLWNWCIMWKLIMMRVGRSRAD